MKRTYLYAACLPVAGNGELAKTESRSALMYYDNGVPPIADKAEQFAHYGRRKNQ